MSARPRQSGGAVHLRTELRPGDLADLAALTRGGFPELNESMLERLILADPAWTQARVIIADQDGAPVGYVHVTCDGPDAYLISGAVGLPHRGQGIGSELLAAALDHARHTGARTLRISGYPPGYAAPGVDVASDPGTAAFLHHRGAQDAGSALAMQLELRDSARAPGSSRPGATPPDATTSDAVVRGFTIAPCTPEEIPAVLHGISAELGDDWAQTFHAHVAAGRPVQQILLAREQPAAEPGRRSVPAPLLGVAGWGIVGEDQERFGPIGVLPAARGRGVGTALLDAVLARMSAAGARRAWFQWTGPDSPAHRMYRRRGFVPLGITTPMTIPVPPSSPERTRA